MFSLQVPLLSLFLIACSTSAFVPNARLSSSQRQHFGGSVVVIKAEESDISSADSIEMDPFDNYVPGSSSLFAFKDTVVGNGDGYAKEGDVVTVKYAGRLLSTNKEFDSGSISFKMGEGRVIPGWDEGLKGMIVGGKRTIKIPPNLAYGDYGAGDAIPPKADLIFDCELEKVETGIVAETIANFGLGLNLRTLSLVCLLLSIILPRFGIGEKGLI
mmetsp:Transcript_11552/g.16170  ORF Transcript_11552/g.16170 Transcript_11552/m.16170 type:complete len:215 (+) Transcript_11552:73-717(+)